MKRPSYKKAIQWIADEDESTWSQAIEDQLVNISVNLVADLFNKDVNKVAVDVYNLVNNRTGRDKLKPEDFNL